MHRDERQAHAQVEALEVAGGYRAGLASRVLPRDERVT